MKDNISTGHQQGEILHILREILSLTALLQGPQLCIAKRHF